MEFVSRMINLIRQPWLLDVLLAVMIGWLVLGVICCVFGAIGLSEQGRKKEIKPYFPAYLPGGQIWYTLKLYGKERDVRIAEQLLLWCPAVAVGALASVAWAAYYYLADAFGVVWWLLAFAVVLCLLVLAAYVWARVLELRVLFPLLKRWEWILSLVGSIFLIPVQRIILFAERKNI